MSNNENSAFNYEDDEDGLNFDALAFDGDYEDDEYFEDERELGYTLYSNKALDIFLRDGEIVNINSEHPNFERLRELLVADAQAVSDEDVRDLINFGFAIGAKLESLSERVKFDGRNVFFDGDTIHSTLGDQIVRMVKDNNPRLGSLVKFMENVAMNPSEESRDSLYSWIVNLQEIGEKLTITKEGMLLAYKGVKINGDGISESIRSGPGIIDGVSMRGHLPNREGSVIEVPRSYVDANNSNPCGPGLHAGTWRYAHGWAQGRVLLVEIHPRDVVACPTDTGCQKLRACRYTVIEETDVLYEKAVFVSSSDDFTWTDEELSQWAEEGFDLDDAREYQEDGFTFEEALDEVSDKSNFDRYSRAEDGEYREDEEDDFEVDSVTIDQWLDAGFTVKSAQEWQNLGYALDEAITEREATCDPLDDCLSDDSDEVYVVKNLTDAFAPKKSKKDKKKGKNKK